MNTYTYKIEGMSVDITTYISELTFACNSAYNSRLRGVGGLPSIKQLHNEFLTEILDSAQNNYKLS